MSSEASPSVSALQTARFGANEILPIAYNPAKEPIALGVWPELSITQADHPTIQRFAQTPSGYPVVASYQDSTTPRPHNQAALIAKDGILGTYNKRMPFGAEADQIQPGTKPITIQTTSMNVGLNICFDSCYPAIMRDTANTLQPDLIALPTLDPVSPNGFVQSAHAAFTPFRAAELGIPIIRAEATADSMLVDARGYNYPASQGRERGDDHRLTWTPKSQHNLPITRRLVPLDLRRCRLHHHRFLHQRQVR